MRRLTLAGLLISALALAQNPKYDFYPEFRNSFTPRVRAENPSRQLSNDQIVAMYAAQLKK